MMSLKNMMLPQGTQGLGAAIQDASPMLLAMAQGLQSGRGIYSGLGQGIEAMEETVNRRKGDSLFADIMGGAGMMPQAPTQTQIGGAGQMTNFNGAVPAQQSAMPMPQRGGVNPGIAGAFSGGHPATDIIKKFEGFRETPYWDVNALRTGYGSDTVTMSDGSVVPVGDATNVTRADAERDLQRRIQTEFMPRAQQAAGDAWGNLNPTQQGVLTSLAYNYGKVPEPVARALKTPGREDDVAAIQGLASHNDGVNAKRRQEEAAMFAGGQGVPSGGSATQVGGGFQGGPDVQRLMQAYASPYLSEQQRGVVGMMLQQQMAQNAPVDPLKQLQIQQAQVNLQKSMQPAQRQPIEVGGVLVDPDTYQPVFDSRQGQETKPMEINGQLVDPATGQVIGDYRSQNAPEQFTLSDGQARYDAQGNMIAQGPQVASEMETRQVKLSDGSEVLVERPKGSDAEWTPSRIPSGGTTGSGQPARKLTESQAKTTLFSQLQTETAPILSEIETIWDPANMRDAVARATPIAGNFFKTEQGQVYQSAATAWAEGALRISTGAAATEPEIERNMRTYFAQPGDTPATVQFKSQMRDMYSRAISASLGNSVEGSGLMLPDDFAKRYKAEYGGEPEAAQSGLSPEDEALLKKYGG